MTFQEIVTHRRSINLFDSERDVSKELLKEMIELAAKTPSSFNLQPWNLVVVRDLEKKKELQALAWDQPKVSEAPLVLIVLADKSGWKEGHPTVERNWQEMLSSGSMQPEQRDWFLSAAKSLYDWSPEANLAFAAKNSGFFAMSLMFSATSYGLETHPMDGFDHEGVRKAFNIPNHFWVPLLLAVGYPKADLELHPPKWRKSIDDIVVSFD